MKKFLKFPELVGVIHLPALPGAPNALKAGALRAAIQGAAHEAKMFEDEGFDAVIVENFGDVPFYKDRVPALTVSAMSVVARAVREATKLPIGINILRNDAEAALAVALAAECQFIRVNVLSGVAATDQGIIEGEAASLMRARAALEAQGQGHVQVWGDALVKHAQSLSVVDMELAVEEVVLRAGADAVIVTGATTGRAIDLDELRLASRHKLPAPLYLGSGATPENVASFRPYLHGVIVGSTLRAQGKAGARLERRRLKKFRAAF